MRFAACFFALAFYMLIGFLSSYLESFFVVFYLPFYFYLATKRSARTSTYTTQIGHQERDERKQTSPSRPARKNMVENTVRMSQAAHNQEK